MPINTTTWPPDARVFQTAHGLVVRPEVVFKHAGGSFTLLNITDNTVHVSFPAPSLPTDPPSADIDPEKSQTFAIGDANRGVYDYWVEIEVTDNRAKKLRLRASGGSDPQIIIDF